MPVAMPILHQYLSVPEIRRWYWRGSALVPVWKNFMALTSARPDCLVSSSGADYIRPGLGLARTVTFLYDQPLGSG